MPLSISHVQKRRTQTVTLKSSWVMDTLGCRLTDTALRMAGCCSIALARSLGKRFHMKACDSR